MTHLIFFYSIFNLLSRLCCFQFLVLCEKKKPKEREREIDFEMNILICIIKLVLYVTTIIDIINNIIIKREKKIRWSILKMRIKKAILIEMNCEICQDRVINASNTCIYTRIHDSRWDISLKSWKQWRHCNSHFPFHSLDTTCVHMFLLGKALKMTKHHLYQTKIEWNQNEENSNNITIKWNIADIMSCVWVYEQRFVVTRQKKNFYSFYPFHSLYGQ